eukprot:TRINITY_DN1299_c0_g1_i1.p2 TRINITY_DN1299_c0_g1~~TRINITY_DN1299_c0_g1_i1.p2  ORF type:complete len:128 (+),score=13.96 TRINITY_DN1299_c0_g1_i1:409-792(+)
MVTWSRIAFGAVWSKRPTTQQEVVDYLISGEICWGTNVKLTNYLGRYMSKYMQKDVIDAAFQGDKPFNWIGGDRVGLSHLLNDELKPLTTEVYPLNSYTEFTDAVNEFAPPDGSAVFHTDFCTIITK